MTSIFMIIVYILQCIKCTTPPTNPSNTCYYPNEQYSQAQCPPGYVPEQTTQQPAQPTPPAPTLIPVPTKVTTKITQGPKPEQTPLDRLIESVPDLAKKIKKVFEYNGIADPWPQFADIVNISQHKLPDPCMLYIKMSDILKVFESLKEMISDELLKIETYVKRAKSYLKEDQELLKRHVDKMQKLMDKINKTKQKSNKSEYAKKFAEEQGKAQEVVERFLRLKKWLVQTLQYFKTLF